MLAAQRRAEILARVRRDGVARVTDLMGVLGVSDVTIRRDIEVLAADGLVRRVHGGAVLADAGPAESTASPNPQREPVKAPTIGMLVPRSAYYFNGVVEGVRAELAGCEGRLLLAVSGYAPEREPELVQGLLDSGAEGLLLSPASADADSGVVDDWVATLGIPVVLVERRAGGSAAASTSWVRSAHEDGTGTALGFLRELGHEHIALFARGDTPTSHAVLRGFSKEVGTLGPPDGSPVLTGGDIPGWPHWNREGVKKLAALVRESGATALLCHSDEDALALLQAGLASEFDIPRQLAIVAYDDEFSEFTSPPLTAVSPPKHDVGRIATRMLLDLLLDPAGAPVIHADVQPRLIIRDSSAPAATPAT